MHPVQQQSAQAGVAVPDSATPAFHAPTPHSHVAAVVIVLTTKAEEDAGMLRTSLGWHLLIQGAAASRERARRGLKDVGRVAGEQAATD